MRCQKCQGDVEVEGWAVCSTCARKSRKVAEYTGVFLFFATAILFLLFALVDATNKADKRSKEVDEESKRILESNNYK